MHSIFAIRKGIVELDTVISNLTKKGILKSINISDVEKKLAEQIFEKAKEVTKLEGKLAEELEEALSRGDYKKVRELVGGVKSDSHKIVEEIEEQIGKSLNQLNNDVKTGNAPKGIKRFDKGRGTKNLPEDEVHFDDGSALYKSGKWRHDTNHKLTNDQIQYLKQNGWTLP